MLTTKHVLLVLITISLGHVASAAEDIAKKSNCMACHAVDKKAIGPSFNDIGRKYQGAPQALEYLAKKTVEGSIGVWGAIPMPPSKAAKPDDIKAVIAWILLKSELPQP